MTGDISIRDELLDEVDEVYEDRGFDSAEEFVNKAIRDALDAESDIPEHLRNGATATEPEDSLSLEDLDD